MGGTSVCGVSGITVVGYYLTEMVTLPPNSGSLVHGFLYNGSTFDTLDDPFAGPNGTEAHGVSGNTVVGYYVDANGVDHGFSYNGSIYSTLDDPLGVNGSEALGVSGSTIVGYYIDSNDVDHGFVYNGSTFTTVDDPLGQDGTIINGIDGDTIVGQFIDDNGVTNGFVATNVPEPTTLGGVFLACVTLIRRHRRHNVALPHRQQL